MESDRSRTKRLRLQAVSAVGVIVIFGIGAVLRSSRRSAGTVVLEIAAAIVIVGAILLVVRRSMGKGAGVVESLRRTEPVSFACYFENGKRGVVSAHNGELIVRRFKGKSLVEDARVPAGSYVISPAKVQLTAVRQADGIAVSDPAEAADGSLRIALSQDKMTLTGNMLKGPELDQAMSSLRQGGYETGPDAANRQR